MNAFKIRLDQLVDSIGRRRSPPPADDLRQLTDRVDALEAMVESLQDSVDRFAQRYDARLTELSRRLAPAEVARSLSEDARKRGL